MAVRFVSRCVCDRSSTEQRSGGCECGGGAIGQSKSSGKKEKIKYYYNASHTNQPNPSLLLCPLFFAVVESCLSCLCHFLSFLVAVINNILYFLCCHRPLSAHLYIYDFVSHPIAPFCALRLDIRKKSKMAIKQQNSKTSL